ncbi:MAG: DUF2079 domain-containing protein [Polyangiales bacterium]
MFSRRTRLVLALLAGAQAALLFALAWTRYALVHQRTFDLALYARISWGLARGDSWSPVLDTHALGSHVAPILWPLGMLGRLLGTVPVLLAAQALCLALTLFPLARIGARRLGTRGIWLAVTAGLLYPNFVHVGTYEFHPGTLAVLPMTWAFDALDRASLRQLAWSLVATLACREDLGMFAALIALVFFAMHGNRRALWAAGVSAVYMACALAVVHAHAPASDGSLDQHFGPWGGSPLGVIPTLFTDYDRVVAHFAARAKLSYLPRVLAPLSFFSLRAPRMLLPGLPYLLLNLISVFPTAHEPYSHYLTPAVPALLVSGIVGVTAVRGKFLRVLWFATLGIAHVAFGGSPLSRDFDRAAFAEDEATRAARAVLAQVPPDESVQAPYPLLPHLAERHDLRRAPPPMAGAAYVVVDVSHRARYAHKEDLLRTREEPLVRALLARPDHALLVYAPPYALFARDRDTRTAALGGGCLVEDAGPPRASDVLLSDCLAVEHASHRARTLTLTLRASGACPADLALRVGPDAMPARVELLCGGTFSPALLREGDRVQWTLSLSERESAALSDRGLWVGALRERGDPPSPHDPRAAHIPLQTEDD